MKLSTLVAGIPPLAAQSGFIFMLRKKWSRIGGAYQAKPIAPQCGHFCGQNL